jgi:ABC-2 type transport system permease protein
MKHFFQVYKAHFHVTMTRYMEYRVELVIWLTSMILRPAIFVAIWTTAARQMGGGIRGFSLPDLATYFIASMLIYHATFAWAMFEWEPRVKNGSLSYMILRPTHPIHRDIGENITFKIATLPVMVVTGIVLALTFHPVLHTQASQILPFIVVMVFAWALHFALAWTLAMTAFYTTQVDAINVVFFFLMLLFSGQMAPLALMPPLIQKISMALPFWWFMGFPVELIMGRLSMVQIVHGIGMQAIWLTIAMVGLVLVWNRGIKTYTAVGI